ncbi:MAG TPA: hypothetical protein VMW10_04155 [Alphaproteobacteria bacterium]|nr:hypothetical protein [Alphaproteobacteria bacterium]
MAKKKSVSKAKAKAKPAKSTPKKAVSKKAPAKKAPAKKASSKKAPAKKAPAKKPAPAEPRERDEVKMEEMPQAPPVAPVQAEVPQTIVEVLSSKPASVNPKALLSYASAIHSTIKRHFRDHTLPEINGLMKNANYPFTYSIKNRGEDFPNEIYIEITDGNNVQRCPLNAKEFIKVDV